MGAAGALLHCQRDNDCCLQLHHWKRRLYFLRIQAAGRLTLTIENSTKPILPLIAASMDPQALLARSDNPA